MHAAVGNDEVAPHARIVAEAGAQVVAPAAVDLADDLPHARQLALDEALRPGLERLGHDGVVRIVDAGGNDGPCLVPAEAVVIEQQAHELGDDERRVRVVDLDDVVLGKVAHRAVARAMGAQDALRRRRDEEILLADAQGLALDVVVRRVEHLRDDLGHRALLQTLDIAAGGEEVHVEVVRAVRLPEAEGVDAPVAIRRDEHIARARPARSHSRAARRGSGRRRPSAARRGRRSAPRPCPHGTARASSRQPCASCPRPRSGGRRRCAAGKCPARSTASSPWRGCPPWQGCPCSTRQGGRDRRCRGLRPARSQKYRRRCGQGPRARR